MFGGMFFQKNVFLIFQRLFSFLKIFSRSQTRENQKFWKTFTRVCLVENKCYEFVEYDFPFLKEENIFQVELLFTKFHNLFHENQIT